MQHRQLHPWDVTPEEARGIQNRLRDQVIHTDQFGDIRTVAEVDLGFKKCRRAQYSVHTVRWLPR